MKPVDIDVQVWFMWLSSIYIFDIPRLIKMPTEMNSQYANQQSDDYQAGSYENQPKAPAHPDQEEMTKEGDDESLIPKTGKFDDGQCDVCLVSPQVDRSFTPCGHTFCFECLLQSSKRREKCPTCRQEITSFHYNDGRNRYDLIENDYDDDGDFRRVVNLTQIELAINFRDNIRIDDNSEVFVFERHVPRYRVNVQYFWPIHELKTKREVLVNCLKNLVSQNDHYVNRYELKSFVEEIFCVDLKLEKMALLLRGRP